MFTQDEIQTILISAILLILFITFIIIIKINKKISQIKDTSLMLLIKCDRIDHMLENIKCIDDDETEYNHKALEYIGKTVNSLSSSNEMVLRKLGDSPQRNGIYPRPQLANEITQTIKEQINIELAKSKKLKVPQSDYLRNITLNVSRTYPEVNLEYIANKTIAIIESMGR